MYKQHKYLTIAIWKRYDKYCSFKITQKYMRYKFTKLEGGTQTFSIILQKVRVENLKFHIVLCLA